MTDYIRTETGLNIGLDLGDKYSHFEILSDDGEIIEEGRVRTTPEHFKARFSGLPKARVAMETGTHSPWASRLVRKCGHEVIVANARQLRLIYENNTKSDQVDADYLARLVRVDPKLLKPIQHRSERAQHDLALIRSRDCLVSTRTKLINHVRGTVKSSGGRVTGASAYNFHVKAVESIPEEIREPLTPLLESIANITQQIKKLDQQIEKLCGERYPETQRLKQVTGVASLTALAFVLVLEDARRFKRSRSVGSFLGLTPRRDDSGRHTPQLRITKAGDGLLRRLLVIAAHYILGPFGPDTDLRRHGERIASRGGKNAKKRAVVAVARKLSVLLHRLWLSDEAYEPLRNSEPKRRQANRK